MSENSRSLAGANWPQCIETVVRCDDCVDICPIFDLAEQQKQLLSEVATLRQQNTDLEDIRLAENDRARRDRKIEGFWNMEGIGHMLATDESLREEFLSGRCGLGSMDVRGLRWVNNEDDHEVGDSYLRMVGARILGQDTPEQSALVRIANRDHGSEDRRVSPRTLDIVFFHISGDEFGIIVRNCTPEGLEKVRERIQRAFSIEQAIETGKQGGIPLIASIGVVHANEMPIKIPDLRNPEITEIAQGVELPESVIAHQALSRAIETSFYAMAKEADERGIAVRGQQYSNMLSTVVSHHAALMDDRTLDPAVRAQFSKELDLCGVFARDFSDIQIRESDFSSAIFKLFLNTFNHTFYTNHVAMLREADRQRRART